MTDISRMVTPTIPIRMKLKQMRLLPEIGSCLCDCYNSNIDFLVVRCYTTKVVKIKFHHKNKEKLVVTPRKHIDKYKDFQTHVMEKLKVLKYLGKSDFIISHKDNGDTGWVRPVDSVILEEILQDIRIIHNFVVDNLISMPIVVNGQIPLGVILKHYLSETLDRNGVKFVASDTYFKKFNEQRLPNSGDEKIKDLFRYSYGIATKVSSANIFPFGVNTEVNVPIFEAYDRSNLTEFLAVNLIKQFDNSNSRDIVDNKISKSDLQDVLTESIKYYGNGSHPRAAHYLEMIKDDEQSTKYSLSSFLGQELIDDILIQQQSVKFLIADHKVISIELAHLNNKNNPWLNINFGCQQVLSEAGISLVDILKDVIDSDKIKNIKKYYKPKMDKAPEYLLLSAIALDIFNKSSFTSKLKEDHYVDLSDLLEGKDGGIDRFVQAYKNSRKSPTFNWDLIDQFYREDVLSIFAEYKKKLKNLEKVIKNLQKNDNHEALKLTESSIKAIYNEYYGYPVYVTLMILFADNKTLKNSIDNVKAAVRIWCDVFLGNGVFEVDLKNNTYKIKSDKLHKLIRNAQVHDGYGVSHKGRSKYFLDNSLIDQYVDEYKKFVDYQGTNEQRTDELAEEYLDICGTTTLGWAETTHSGGVTYCQIERTSWSLTIKKTNISFEHLDNSSQKFGVLRSSSTNSSDGAKTKGFGDKPSEYFTYILKEQDNPNVIAYYDENNMGGFDYRIRKLYLEKLIEHYKEIGC